MKIIKRFLLLTVFCLLTGSFLTTAAAETDEMQAELDAKVAQVIASEITDGMTDYEKALALHNWLIDNMVYQAIDDSEGTDYTAHDAIVLGRGVCHAYAMGYAELLNAVGIVNDYELGYDHIWNIIELDGQWYHVDCTWDDNDGANTFFCLPNAAIQAAPNHECEIGEHIGTDYTMSYLYRYGLLDAKINGVAGKIQQQFDLGVYEFIFSPDPNIGVANGNGWDDNAVETVLLEMILADTEFTAGGEVIVPEITLDEIANTVTVVAEGPEISIPDDEEPEDPEVVFSFIKSPDNPRYGIYAYSGTAQRVIIPDGVVEIFDHAFENCTTMREIVFPDSLTTIQWNAFSGCVNLRSVTLPPNLTRLDSNAFKGCTNLSSVTLPDSLTYLGSYVFEACPAITSIVLPDSLTSLNIGLFQDCFSLRSLTLPSGLTKIPSYLCLACTSLESIVIPDGVTSIGYRAFDDCSALASLKLNEGLESIGEQCFGALAITELTLPSTLTSIGEWSFQNCASLKKVSLPDNMAAIPTGCFYECSALETVTFPEGLTTIGINAFNRCSSLATITLPSTLTTIGTYAFDHCTALKKLVLPKNVTSIGTQPFSYATTVQVSEGSYAHTWCEENGQAYELLTTHIWSPDIIITAQTCTTEGEMQYLCTICGETRTEVIPPHFWHGGILSSTSNGSAMTYACRLCSETKTVSVTIGQPGDVNADGLVDMLDIIDLMEWYCDGLVELNLANADVNADTDVDMLDIITLMQWYCGEDVSLQSGVSV